jgi:transaldolase
MKLFAAGPEPAELAGCAADGLCEGLVVLGAGAAEPSPEARERLRALAVAGAGPVLVEVASAGDGAALAALGPRFAARLPFAAGGVDAIRACLSVGVETNAVGCTTPEEAVAAARAGAAWVSLPLTGAAPGVATAADHDLVRKTRALLKALGLRAQLLAGPLRDVSVLFDSTLLGAEIALVSPAILRRIAARGS